MAPSVVVSTAGETITVTWAATNPDAFGTYPVTRDTVGLYGTAAGVPKGTTFAKVVDDPRWVAPATGTFEGWQFHGNVDLTGSSATFRHCDFAFRPTTAYARKPAVTATDANGATLVDCDVHALFDGPVQPIGATVGVMAHNVTLTRVKVYDVADAGIYPTKGNVTANGCWVGDLLYFSPDPDRQANNDTPPWFPDHADAVQIADGSDYTFNWCVLEGFNNPARGQASVPDSGQAGSNMGWQPGRPNLANSAVMLNLKAGMRRIAFRNCTIRGGRAGVNMGGTVDGPTVELSGCRFDRTATTATLIVPARFGGNVTMSGLLYEGDGTPVAAKRW